jgi:type II protein arginine methyltransferase
MEEETQRHLDLARQCFTNGSYSKSFECYLKAFSKNPDLKNSLESEFREVLMRFNQVLLNAGRMDDIFLNFTKASEIYPSNSIMINDIGKYLYKFGFYMESWGHFQKALKLNPKFVNAEKNLNSIKNLLLERWHFRMLNDKTRNEAYYDALNTCIVRLKDSVLDIGTGTGILAMFASDCSATAVTGIEASENMAWMAECVVQGNNKHDIVIVNNMSTTMNYRDIGGKRSLVVTEMFDAGLFGEHILQTLCHAWEYFTIPTTRIVPNKAEFFVVAANSKYLDRKYRLGSLAKKRLNVSNFDFHVLNTESPYDCEDIHMIKDVKYMSEPKSLLRINFNDYRDVQEKLSRTEPYTANLTATEDGEVNIIIGWFNLYLTSHITLTTDPRSNERANAWQQAVFFGNIPKTVKKNDSIHETFLINEGKITFVEDSHPSITKISPETLRFLNDDEYIKMIAGCIGMTCIYLGQMDDVTQVNLVDLCPFPVFGLLMMKRGAHSLVCYAKTDHDVRFFKKVFKANKVPWSKITVLIGEEWGPEVFGNNKYHGIFCNILDMWGDIEMRFKEVANILKSKHLLPEGLFMPASVKLMVQVINSHWVDINNRVYDENVKDYKIAEYINKYEVTQNFCIDFTHLEYTAVTDPLNLGSVDCEARVEIVNMPVLHGGPANAIMCWYIIELMADLDEISTRRPESFTDGMLYLIHPKKPYLPGTSARFLRCIDPDGSFKLMLEPETT